MTVKLSPLAGAGWQFFDDNGVPLAGGLLYQYQAGTTTPQTTYTTSAGNIANSNPIQLDAAGRTPDEVWLTVGSIYKFVLRDSASNLIGTYDDITGINDVTDGSVTLAANLANTADPAKGDALVGFRQSNNSGLLPNSVGQTVHRKLQERVSVFDFMTQAEINSVVARNYSVDVTAAITNAIASGAKTIIFPDGGYKITSGFVITSTTTARQFIGEGEPIIKLYTAVQSSIFEVQAGNQFLYFENLRLDSNGSKNDGLQTYGILTMNLAYSYFYDIRCTNFSGAGMEHRQCVYLIVNNYTANNCFYGLSWQKYLGVQCTAATVNSAYISGCTRAVTQDGAVAMQYNQLILEYSGDAVSSDAAFHIDGGQCQANYLYCEANNRNILIDDATVDFIGKYIFSATAPDIITYLGIPFSERGVVQVLPYEIQTPRLKPDSLTSRDLTVGENLVAPVAGGSVEFGNTTTSETSGTVTSGSWTTIYTFTDISGTNGTKASYLYTVYIGLADLSTGFDTGTIFNGTAYSASGTLPAWLQLSGNNLQINVTSSSYGLNYRLVLLRTFPGQ